MATIQITSVFTGQTFDGEVDTTDLEEIFRMFNRVTEADSIRLDLKQFNQPSLSSGDIVVLNNENWLCASTGWAHLTDNQAAAYRYEIERTADDDDRYTPMFAKLKGDTLTFLGDDGETEIAPDGSKTVAA